MLTFGRERVLSGQQLHALGLALLVQRLQDEGQLSGRLVVVHGLRGLLCEEGRHLAVTRRVLVVTRSGFGRSSDHQGRLQVFLRMEGWSADLLIQSQLSATQLEHLLTVSMSFSC